MEIVQGKSTKKKIVIAQEIAFAKVLAGNNKTLRDRAVKKLKKWMSVRGNGKWAFTEDEFIRIWTGLFYCMWMSDKFLVQEELAENISNLIHCFKKNSDNALLFIKCFYKRILMEWAGLDQYRIDKFCMLARRFLRQSFKYCKYKDWDKSVLKKLVEIFDSVVLHKDSSLGFVLHFISIFAEELAKVGNGKLKNETVLILIEPFVRLISRSKDDRVLQEAEDFFNYLMRQTDVGIESEEQFLAWKQRGFPGEGPHSLKKIQLNEDNDDSQVADSDEDDFEAEDEKPLDPRAGSVHVLLPQIPIDEDGILNLLKKYEQNRQTVTRGRKRLRCLTQKFAALKKGKFPEKIKKDEVLLKNTKKRRQTKINAENLLEFREKLFSDKGPIKTKEFKQIYEELENQESSEDEDSGAVNEIESETEEDESEEELEKIKPEKTVNGKVKKLCNDNNKTKVGKKKKMMNGIRETAESEDVGEKENKEKTKASPLAKVGKKKKMMNGVQETSAESEEDAGEKENREITKKKKKSKKQKKMNGFTGVLKETDESKPVAKRKSLNGLPEVSDADTEKVTPTKRRGIKRKLSNSWRVEELDTSRPDYYKIKPPNVIRIERKVEFEEIKEPEVTEKNEDENEQNQVSKQIVPAFWQKAISKVNSKKEKAKVLKNPFTDIIGENKSSNSRKISFALDKNMAQENEEYLEEVKNSPRVPFDGTKKPVQSALKSGLSPSPVNPFYRFKRIKF